MGIIIFDADNTLWDTNEVFTNAQMAILKKLTEYTIEIDPSKEFSILRKFDDRLIKLHGSYEYDYWTLPYALYLFYKKGMNEEDATDRAYKMYKKKLHDDIVDIAKECDDAFKKEQRKIPRLFPNTHFTLNELKKKGHTLILSSEGKRDRIIRVLKEHKIDNIFSQISTDSKSKEVFNILIKNAQALIGNTNDQVTVVGDMLKREIFIGNSLGVITVYKPGGYKPDQQPQKSLEKPDYQIQHIQELLTLLH